MKEGGFSPRPLAEERRRWPPLATVVILVLCVVAALGGDELRELGRYRHDVLATEPWRLITGHLLHLSAQHLWPNMAALLILGSLFHDVVRNRDWVIIGLASAGAIDLGLFLLEPDVEWYVGLSGVLHGIVAAGALELLFRGERLGALLAIGLCAKLIFEQTFGPVPLSVQLTAGPVIVAAHLYGAAGGFLATVIPRYFRRWYSEL